MIAVSAQAAWPEDRPIEVYVGFAAGGGTDLLARAMAPFLQKHLGGKARIVVVNKPGASGEIAYLSLSRATPDGYTIGIISTPSFLTIPIQRKPKYDPAAIVPLARVIDDPTMFVVAGDSKLASMADLVKQLKGNPEGLSMGSNGIGTNGHMAALALQQATGAKGQPHPLCRNVADQDQPPGPSHRRHGDEHHRIHRSRPRVEGREGARATWH
ncbi:tripartite tricarboxylate transporter substrate binding protein [Cupriavidus sp. H18C2]|uniref:tripartite tricarboxylate transporter substrate binding protein n=1 Tax=Cupriavidus sp. H18C2 TaxID=3241602 RepID=UPI003BF7C75A